MDRPRVLLVQEFLHVRPQSVPNDRKPKPKARAAKCEELQYFCRTTGNHGLAHIVDSNELFFLRITWAVVFASLASIVVLFIYLSVANLVSGTLTTEFLERKDGEDGKGVVLPDIHFCDATIFNSTRLKEMGFNDNMATYLTLATSDNAVSPPFRDNNSNHMALKTEFNRILQECNCTIKYVIEIAAIKCEDIVFLCSKAGKFYHSEECCDKFFTNLPYVSIFGSCISTHGKRTKQMYESRDACFVVYITPNTFDIINFDWNLIKSEYILQQGLYYAVSSPAVHIASVLHRSGRFAAPNSWASVPITKSVMDNSELKNNALAPYSCVDNTDALNIKQKTPQYNQYNEANCIMAFNQNLFKQSGNCSVPFFKYEDSDSVQLCHPHYLLTFNPTNITCPPNECPKECVSDTYELSPSNAVFNATLLGQRYGKDLNKYNPVVLHFFYPSFTYQIRKTHTNTFLKWLGEVGGNLGLLLGASLISILEIFALFLRCCIKCR